MYIPIESLEVANEGKVDMAWRTFLVERSPMLVIVSNGLVQYEVEELGKSKFINC